MGHKTLDEISNDLHAAVAVAVNAIRETFSEANIGNIRLDIEASGRVNAGEILVTYKLGEQYGSNTPEGHRLAPVLDEFMRRKGWNERHKPLALPPPPSNDDEPVDESREPERASAG